MNQSAMKRDISGMPSGAEPSPHNRKFRIGVIAMLICQGSLVVLLFGMHVLLARFLGVDQYGVFTYAWAWMTCLAVLASMGMDRFLVKQVSVLSAKGEWSVLRGILRWSNMTVIIASTLTALVVSFVAWVVTGFEVSSDLEVFWVAMSLLPIISLNRVCQAALCGFHHILVSQIPLLTPQIVFLILAGCVLWMGGKFDSFNAMRLYGFASVTGLIVSLLLLRRYRPVAVGKASPSYLGRIWLPPAFSIMLVSGMQIINTYADILMLGAITGVKYAGIYTVATRAAGVVTLVLVAFNIALAPTFAKRYATGELGQLQKYMTRCSRLILLLSFPVAVGLMVFGKWLLLICGEAFVEGWYPLTVLCCAQLFSSFVGPVALLLMMSGHEKRALFGTGLGALTNVVLNAILIPQYGMAGAAWATGMSIVVWNVALSLSVFQKIRIFPTVIGRIFRVKA